MHFISVMLTIKGINKCFDGIPEICDFDIKKNVVFVPKNQKFNFCQKCLLVIKKHKNENRIPFWPSVKRTWQIFFLYPILDLSIV